MKFKSKKQILRNLPDFNPKILTSELRKIEDLYNKFGYYSVDSKQAYRYFLVGSLLFESGATKEHITKLFKNKEFIAFLPEIKSFKIFESFFHRALNFYIDILTLPEEFHQGINFTSRNVNATAFRKSYITFIGPSRLAQICESQDQKFMLNRWNSVLKFNTSLAKLKEANANNFGSKKTNK